MSLVIIFLSYCIGCISTIGILICLYIRYGLYPPGPVIEQESFQKFHPLSENDLLKNSTIDAVNYLFQFLFQELKDTSKIRRYVVKKLTEEFEDIKKTKIGKLFVQDISIRSFSMGKECPVFHDIQLERQERDERKLIKEVVAKLIVDYKDGFSMTLDLKLLFGYTCQLFIKVKRVQGRLHLEFRREPFSHWLVVFQEDPKIDFDIKSYLSSRESTQLAHIINQQIRRIIRRKQTWPSYKIRYKPFFSSSTKQSLSNEIPSFNDNHQFNRSRFYISIKSCDRFSIPFDVIKKDQYPLFISIDINEQICEDYLRINRNQWIQKILHFQPKFHHIDIKEINYMNRKEFLIEQFNPIPNEIDDKQAFKIALENRNIFLMKIEDTQVQTLKQIHSFIHDGSEQIEITIGMPLLHTVQVRRTVEFLNTIRQQTKDEIEQSTDSEQQNSELIKPTTDKITLVMINNDLIPKVQAKRISRSRDAEYPEFDNREYKFQVGSTERFLNICLWCEPRLDFDVSNVDKKCVLLGYTSAVLSEIIFDAQMSFNRETQMTLNFRSIYSDNRISKLAELSRHKGYDDNMTHGFVTINIRYEPDNDIQSNQDRSSSFESINEKDEEHETSSFKSTDHIFEDQHFTEETSCAYCHRKIWMKTGRQCRDCLITVHQKCEVKFNPKNICTHEPTIVDDEKSLLSLDDIDSGNVKHESLRHRSFRRFRKINVDQTSESPTLELSKNEDSDHSVEKRVTTSQPTHRSSKIVNAASSAYSKFREFKTKRSSTSESKKSRLSQDLTTYEDISENDLQDIITKCLSDENIDTKSLDDLFHEKAIDNTAVYVKANEFGPELFGDITPEERKQKLDNEIHRLLQEIDLQNRIRDEMIIECNNNLTDEHAKRNIEAKLDNIDEKIQALRALTLFYCSGLKYCRSEIESKGDNSKRNSKTLDDSE